MDTNRDIQTDGWRDRYMDRKRDDKKQTHMHAWKDKEQIKIKCTASR
jgi:hypothetical protein